MDTQERLRIIVKDHAAVTGQSIEDAAEEISDMLTRPLKAEDWHARGVARLRSQLIDNGRLDDSLHERAAHDRYVDEGHCSSISDGGLWCGRLAGDDHEGFRHRAVRVETPGEDVDPETFVRPQPIVVEW